MTNEELKQGIDTIMNWCKEHREYDGKWWQTCNGCPYYGSFYSNGDYVGCRLSVTSPDYWDKQIRNYDK